MIEFAPYFITALIYAIVSADFWLDASAKPSLKISRWHPYLIAVGLILHACLLYKSLFTGGLNLGLSNALSAIFWLTVLIYWLTDLKHHLNSLQAFVLPPAAFFVLLQYLMPEAHLLPYANQP